MVPSLHATSIPWKITYWRKGEEKKPKGSTLHSKLTKKTEMKKKSCLRPILQIRHFLSCLWSKITLMKRWKKFALFPMSSGKTKFGFRAILATSGHTVPVQGWQIPKQRKPFGFVIFVRNISIIKSKTSLLHTCPIMVSFHSALWVIILPSSSIHLTRTLG